MVGRVKVFVVVGDNCCDIEVVIQRWYIEVVYIAVEMREWVGGDEDNGGVGSGGR